MFIKFLLISFAFSASASDYNGSSPKDIWKILKSDLYRELPSATVSYQSLFDGAISLIERSALRTLNDENDLLSRFNKLAHPNGVCLKGNWMISEKTNYSGLFKKNSEAIIIARASVALSETESGSLRGMGFAGKLFPTANESEKVKTANFFLIDDLGGTKAAHYTDVEMTNEPKVSTTFAVLANLKYAFELARTFKKVDENPTKRQVYEIAEATREKTEKLKSPKWMMIKASAEQFKLDEADFRNEINLTLSRGSLSFDIFTAESANGKQKNWQKIGRIVFDESIASDSCDHKLHFHHPKWRSDLE